MALTALDEVNLDSTVVATPVDTEVECNCAGVKAGRAYTAHQLLEASLLVSGNDAANTLATRRKVQRSWRRSTARCSCSGSSVRR